MLQVVGAVLLQDNKILLTKRSATSKSYPNKFEFPGGKLEINETHKQALIRELKEELDIEVKFENIYDFTHNNLKLENLSLTLFIVSSWDGYIKLNPNIHSELIEVLPIDLVSIDNIIENDIKLISPLLQNLHYIFDTPLQ